MNGIETGMLVAKLRKEAGFTQKTLADALFVTDKAVSKWERGLCLPDVSLFPKLSVLLDVDMEYLVACENKFDGNLWAGEIIVNDFEYEIGGKPLIFYLISYLMLVGIKDICIKTNDKEYIKKLNLSQYGLNISFESFNKRRTIVIYDKFLLFGVNLTRQFQNCMSKEHIIEPVVNGVEIPLVFARQANLSFEWNKNKAEKKKFGRGLIYMGLSTEEEKKDASQLINVYEKYSGYKIADLKEIALKRGLI